ncbi:MAG: RecX family transcriptional regulator [Actinomycetota bacterium]
MTDPLEDEAFNKVCNYLSFRQRTEREIRQYLTKHDLVQVADDIITRLKRAGLIDDERFALTWIRERSVNKGYGQRRLRNELRRLGVNAELIEKSILATYSEEDETNNALELARKRWDSLALDNPRVKRNKIYAFLIRRGYPSSTAIEAIEVVVRATEGTSWSA